MRGIACVGEGVITCGGAMRSGFLVERDSPTQTSTYGEGVYWSPEEYGFIERRVALS